MDMKTGECGKITAQIEPSVYGMLKYVAPHTNMLNSISTVLTHNSTVLPHK